MSQWLTGSDRMGHLTSVDGSRPSSSVRVRLGLPLAPPPWYSYSSGRGLAARFPFHGAGSKLSPAIPPWSRLARLCRPCADRVRLRSGLRSGTRPNTNTYPCVLRPLVGRLDLGRCQSCRRLAWLCSMTLCAWDELARLSANCRCNVGEHCKPASRLRGALLFGLRVRSAILLP